MNSDSNTFCDKDEMKSKFWFLLKLHQGVSGKLVSPPRFSLTVSVWFGRDNSIRWGAASGPTDAAVRLQNSGDKIKWRCAVRNAINRPTRCGVRNAINALPEIPAPPPHCDWDYKLSPPDEIKTRRLGHPDHEIITRLWRLKQKKIIITQWNENLIFLIRSLPPSFRGNPIRFQQCWLRKKDELFWFLSSLHPYIPPFLSSPSHLFKMIKRRVDTVGAKTFISSNQRPFKPMRI